MKESIDIGIIGGSGVYDLDWVAGKSHVRVESGFGKASDDILIGDVEGCRVGFLPRHGRHHSLLPGEINYCANIMALKILGARSIVSVTAVGSLQNGFQPGDVVIVDQIVDKTSRRRSTFFGNGAVAHVSMADPFCHRLSSRLQRLGAQVCGVIRKGASLVTIEGPAFSTRAESKSLHQQGFELVGMTTAQEAKLSKEAEMCFAAIAMVTDFDSWRADGEPVSHRQVQCTLKDASKVVMAILRYAAPRLDDEIPGADACGCASTLRDALATPVCHIPHETAERIKPLLLKYF